MFTPTNMFGNIEHDFSMNTFPGPDTQNVSYMKKGNAIRILGLTSL